jgi:hypothetical protein
VTLVHWSVLTLYRAPDGNAEPVSTCECHGVATAIQHPVLAVNIETIGARAEAYIGRTAQLAQDC